MNRKIRMGMAGGSQEGFIGNVHRMAAALDGQIELVCGAFSSDPKRSFETGNSLYLKESRIYKSYEEMILKEKALPKEQRMDFLSVVTPNHLHFLPSKLALENGFHVLCEKPLAFSVEEAEALEKIVQEKGLVFGVTHNYTGYPMVKEAQEIVKSGKLGKIRKVIAEYPQGWLSQRIEEGGQKQAGWRTDPKQAGISCCVGDIGTHAENLVEYISGLKITELCADITTFVEGRLLEDDANILIRFDNGAKGVIIASQIAAGEENELKVRIYGEHGSIEWLQSDPNSLIVKSTSEPKKVLRTGAGYSYLSEKAKAHTRLPGGHPEGYLESMANLYRNFAYAVDAHINNIKPPTDLYDFPTVSDGVRGMKFIEAVIQSGKSNGKWEKI
jgi:predicted dehydrogenase